MTEIYRAEVVGSMLRPDELNRARAEHDAGRLDDAELERIENEAVDGALAIQAQAGVEVVTDGEMRRFLFTGPLTEAIEGIEPTPGETLIWHERAGDHIDWQQPICVTGKLRRTRSIAMQEYEYARSRTELPLKVTLPSPLMLSLMWSPQHSTAAYSDPFDAFADGAEIVSQDARELAAAGCEYIQIDAPELATLVDPEQRDFYESIGVSPRRMLTDGMEIINEIATVPGVHWGIHLCRGNNQGMWMGAGGYGAISRDAFGRATNFDALLLEYDTDRAGDFAPLRDAPEDKTIVLGLVSTKTDELEGAGELLARIDEAGEIVDRERLALSTQCGFASVAMGNPIAWDTQLAKLRRVSEVAERAWG